MPRHHAVYDALRNRFIAHSIFLILCFLPNSDSFSGLHHKLSARFLNFGATALSDGTQKNWQHHVAGGVNRNAHRCNSFSTLRMSDSSHAVIFDPTSGYGDMTGVKSFDDAWIDAFRKKDRIRCPFWRRRAVDFLEAILSGARFLLARHKSLDVTPVTQTGHKSVGLTMAEFCDVLRADFEQRQYYVTGRLTKGIYADDCYFDAPDPDMPVKGLRKYVDAISHLFEHRSSRVDLLSLEVVDEHRAMARWRLEGTLMLPWRPKVRGYTGVTVYTRAPDTGLVARHVELWSISPIDAFGAALLPDHWPVVAAALANHLPPAWTAGLNVAAAPSADELRRLPPAQRAPDPAPLLLDAR